MKPTPLTILRAGAVAVVAARLAKGARMRPPVTPPPGGDRADGASSISVVVPARDEAARIGPLLDALDAMHGVDEVIVVDDQSSDGTAAMAAERGAKVLTGGPRPDGWAGKAWALQQGIAAATGEWVVALDADTVPEADLAVALVTRAIADGSDLISVGARFDCPTPGARWLHPAMLATIVYRFGPPGQLPPPASHRALANGQCLAFRREALLEVGGLAPVAGSVVEDVALARWLASIGWQVDFLDGADVLEVRMYDSLPDTWRGWGRSLGLPGLDSRTRRLFDIALLALVMVLPLGRLLTRRADVVDAAALAVRVGTVVATARAYGRRDLAYWASPLADPLAVGALVVSAASRRQVWRGRSYAT